MAFITKDDYSVIIRTEIKDILLENYSQAKLQAAEQMAISQVRNYLSGRYDVESIFTKIGDKRNSHIVMTVIDCALYHLYTSASAIKIPEIRSQRYQDAIEWLKMVGKGQAAADLPNKKNTDGSTTATGNIRLSSKYSKLNNKW